MPRLQLGPQSGAMARIGMGLEEQRRADARQRRALRANLRAQTQAALERRRTVSAQMQLREKELKSAEAQQVRARQEAVTRRGEAKERYERGQAEKAAQMEAQWGLTVREGKGGRMTYAPMTPEERQEKGWGSDWVPYGLRGEAAAKERREADVLERQQSAEAKQFLRISRAANNVAMLRSTFKELPEQSVHDLAWAFSESANPQGLMHAAGEAMVQHLTAMDLFTGAMLHPKAREWAGANPQRVKAAAQEAAKRGMKPAEFDKWVEGQWKIDRLDKLNTEYDSATPQRKREIDRIRTTEYGHKNHAEAVTNRVMEKEWERAKMASPQEVDATTRIKQEQSTISKYETAIRGLQGKLAVPGYAGSSEGLAAKAQLKSLEEGSAASRKRLEEAMDTRLRFQQQRHDHLRDIEARMLDAKQALHERSMWGGTKETFKSAIGTLVDMMLSPAKALEGPTVAPEAGGGVAPEGPVGQVAPEEAAAEGGAEAPAAEAKAPAQAAQKATAAAESRGEEIVTPKRLADAKQGVALAVANVEEAQAAVKRAKTEPQRLKAEAEFAAAEKLAKPYIEELKRLQDMYDKREATRAEELMKTGAENLGQIPELGEKHRAATKKRQRLFKVSRKRGGR